MLRKRLILVTVASLVMLLMWQSVRAEVPVQTHPAQKQVKQVLPSLIDSEAEHASGAYIPGVGAVFTMDLLRGPNSVKGKASEGGTRDWMIYLMQTFGPKLTAVPPDETIAMSVEFYDYAQVTYHQLAITSRAGDVADPAKYKIWLDGKSYAEVTTGQATSNNPAPATTKPAITSGATVNAGQPTATAKAGQATTAPVATAVPGNATTPAAIPSLVALTGSFKVGLDFTKQPGTAKEWNALNGKWEFTAQGYDQSELGKFDLISLYNQPVSGNYRLQVDMKYLEGDMGGGLVFNAPNNNTKKGAYMVSYTAKGTYLQWGYFDENSIYQYQGGLGVANGGDGQKHTLEVRVTGKTCQFSLDGKVLAQQVALPSAPGGFVGLLSSTSHVTFNNIILESTQS